MNHPPSFGQARGGWRAWALALSAAGALLACGYQGPVPQVQGGAGGGTGGAGAKACRGASQTNPSARAPGLGGTGAPAAPGGIGGTGQVASPGLGGTGIVGVVTGFASICVNGVEVTYAPDTPVEREGLVTPVSELAVGHVVAVQAEGEGDQLRAHRIAVMDAAVGPVTGLDMARSRVSVMGQAAQALERADLVGLKLGQWVRVSGLRQADGEIRATRVQPTEPGQASLSGPVRGNADQGLDLAGTPVALGRVGLPAGWSEGQEMHVRGTWTGVRLVADEVRAQPTLAAMGRVREVVLQGYVHQVQGNELRLGYQSITLSDGVRVVGGTRETLRPGQSVQVRGRLDDQQRVRVDTVVLRHESGRGSGSAERNDDSPPAAAARPDDNSSSNNSNSGSGSRSSGSDDGGRGRGRGRGGDGQSSGSSSGSGSEGGDSGRGRGRGRGGDSGSSSSGSSSSGSTSGGSGSSGSSSSGSGSSGSGSSGSSGGGSDSDSGRGRGRGRSGGD